MRTCHVALGLAALFLSVSCSDTEPGRVAAEARVTLHVYSGRPDPSWSLDKTRTDDLMRRAYALPASVEPPNFPPSKLGYRGFDVQVFDASGQLIVSFTAYGGTVRRTQEAVANHTADVDRAVERWLLQSGQAALDPDLYASVEGQIQ